VIPALELRASEVDLPAEGAADAHRGGPLRRRGGEPRRPTTTSPTWAKSAFAHKGGIHVAAMRRNEDQLPARVDPALVGNRDAGRRERALRAAATSLSKAEELGARRARTSAGVLGEIKELESQGFSFEAAEASVAMLMKRQEPGYRPPFALVDFLVQRRAPHRARRSSPRPS